MKIMLFAIVAIAGLCSSCSPKLTQCERYALEMPRLRVIGRSAGTSPADAFQNAQLNAITAFSENLDAVLTFVATKHGLMLNDVISRNVHIEDLNQKCTTFSKKRPIQAITCFEYEGDIDNIVNMLYSAMGKNISDSYIEKWRNCEKDIKQDILQELTKTK